MIDNISIRFAYTDYTEVSVKYQNRLHSVILNVGSEIELNLISLISVSMIKSIVLHAAVCTAATLLQMIFNAVSSTRRRAILEFLLADSS